jgi:branched-chain amino acid transport system substrate-binding protein
MVKTSRITLSLGLAGAWLAAASGGALADELELGVAQGLTGGSAFVGIPVLNAIRMAVDESNSKKELGDSTIKLIVQDTGSDKTQALSVFNKMALQTKALMIMGPTSSGEALTTGPLVNQLKIAQYGMGVSSEIPKSGPFSFKGQMTGEDIISDLATFAADKIKVKTCAVVVDRVNDGYVMQARKGAEVLRAKGIKVVSEDSVVSTDTDFSGLGTKLAGAGIDCIMVSMSADIGANLIVQAKQNGLSDQVKIFAIQAMASPQWVDIGQGAVEGSYIVSDFDPTGGTPESKAFIENYEKRFNIKPTNYSALGYTMTKVVIAAIKKSMPNPDRQKVRDALGATKDFPAIIGNGRYTIDENRFVSYGATMLTVKDGQFRLAEQK